MANQSISQRFLDSIRLPGQFILLLWMIHLVQSLFGLGPMLAHWGVYPREIFGLPGVIFSPLIHSDWGHLLSNTPPLFFLGVIVMFFYRRVAIRSFLMIYLLTGIAVWLFGRSVFHIGASGVVYGLVAFVFWNGIFRRNIKSIVLALIVVFYYGSMFLGVLPNQEGISWESHLLGALAGVFASFWYKGSLEEDEQRQPYSWELEEDGSERYLLDRDIFERTKAEREREKQENDDLPHWFSNRT